MCLGFGEDGPMPSFCSSFGRCKAVDLEGFYSFSFWYTDHSVLSAFAKWAFLMLLLSLIILSMEKMKKNSFYHYILPGLTTIDDNTFTGSGYSVYTGSGLTTIDVLETIAIAAKGQ